MLAAHRYRQCHPALPVPDIIRPDVAPDSFDRETSYEYRQHEEKYDAGRAGIGYPVMGTGAQLRTLLTSIKIIKMNIHPPVESGESEVQPRAVWVIGSHPSPAHPNESDYLAAMLKKHTPHQANNFTEFSTEQSEFVSIGSYAAPAHAETYSGFIADTALPGKYVEGYDPDLLALVGRVRQAEANSFSLIKFTGPDELPDPYITASGLVMLQHRWNSDDAHPDDSFDIRPQAIADASEPFGVSNIHNLGRAVLTDEAMFEYGVPDHLVELCDNLDIADSFTARAVEWRGQRKAIDTFTQTSTLWGNSPIPPSCDMSSPPKFNPYDLYK